MTFYKGNHAEPAQGRPARQARSDLKDRRAGAAAPKPAQPMRERRTAHADAQWGSGVQPETGPRDAAVPEGLRREPAHPINPSTGRGAPATHVPEHAPPRKP